MPLRSPHLRLFAAVAALMCCAPTVAQPTDTAVKAAFLPRFARYVTWPSAAMPRAGDPIVLCVIGTDPFGRMLDGAARTQSIDGRRIAVRRLYSAVGADGCQIAFVDSGHGQPTSEILSVLAARPVLTVTDAANGPTRGIVHFVVADRRVRFLIDQSAAERRGLAISSRLLALAVEVR